MHPDTPPPLPKPARNSMNGRNKLFIGLALVPACFVGALFALRICGLIRPFSVPTAAMAPAVSAGDHVMMEGMTFIARPPRRGDIIVFRTDGIASLPPAQFYIKRVAGEPGDQFRISDGKLFINDKPVALSNAMGEVVYRLQPVDYSLPPKTTGTVPKDGYFVLGDNSTNSFDSRFWGSVPRGNIIGRIAFCYWPPERIGGVK